MNDFVNELRKLRTFNEAIAVFDRFITKNIQDHSHLTVENMCKVAEFKFIFKEICMRPDSKTSPFFLFFEDALQSRALQSSEFGQRVKQLEVDIKIEYDKVKNLKSELSVCEKNTKIIEFEKQVLLAENVKLGQLRDSLNSSISRLNEDLDATKRAIQRVEAKYKDILSNKKLNTIHNKFLEKSARESLDKLKKRNNKTGHFVESIVKAKFKSLRIFITDLQDLEKTISIMKQTRSSGSKVLTRLSKTNLDLIHPELHDAITHVNLPGHSIDERLAVFNLCKSLLSDIELAELAHELNGVMKDDATLAQLTIDPTNQLSLDSLCVFAKGIGIELNLQCAKQFMYNKNFTGFVYTCLDPFFKKASMIFTREYLKFKGVL